MKRNMYLWTRGTIASISLACLAISANAAVHTVDCDAGGKIAPVLATAKAGDTVTVSGICKESVLFTPAMSGITLDGQGKATLQGPPHDVVPTKPSDFTVFVLGRDIRITGFTILGGSHAIHLSGPATVVIDKNVIRQSAGAIHLDKGSIGTIYDNVIEDNRGYGINLIENSYARIGFRIPTLPKPQTNVIRNNDGPGIIVGRWSSAWVVGNQIMNNRGHGVIVDRQSQADVQANEISGNGGDGIRVSHGSGVNFDSEGSDMVIKEPNRSTMANGGAGVRCEVGGYVSGRLGALTGKLAARQTSQGCIDHTIP
jgi:Right handed beta helix region